MHFYKTFTQQLLTATNFYDQQHMVSCDSVRMNHLLLRSALTMMIVRVIQMRTLLRDVSITTFIWASTTGRGHSGNDRPNRWGSMIYPTCSYLCSRQSECLCRASIAECGHRVGCCKRWLKPVHFWRTCMTKIRTCMNRFTQINCHNNQLLLTKKRLAVFKACLAGCTRFFMVPNI